MGITNTLQAPRAVVMVRPHAFHPNAETAKDNAYHTNVLMCIGTDFALVGLDMIPDPARRDVVRRRLEETARDVIALSADQIADFAGNAIELTGTKGRILALSSRAMAALTANQRDRICASATLLPLSLPTIECASGSAR
jgi:hypothetical protein